MLLKTKLLKLKETDRNYQCFYNDKELKKENFLILTKQDILLCIDEFDEETVKEYNRHYVYYKIIKLYFNSCILYIPITIIKYKKSNFIFTDKFVVL